jgi:hypothetical protein
MVLEHQKIAEGTSLLYWVEAVAYAVALPLSQDLSAEMPRTVLVGIRERLC